MNMTYNGITELPEAVRSVLPAEAQAVFRDTLNAAFGDGEDEEASFAAAWAAVKEKWQAPPEGATVWMAKYALALTLDIAKQSEDQQVVYGWLSIVADKDGKAIVDKQGDIIPIAELEAAAQDFMLTSRNAGDMHERVTGIGKVVESMVFTTEKMAKLGIPPGSMPEGWWVGFHIDDSDTWAKVKDGTYKAFSIGGSATRTPLT